MGDGDGKALLRLCVFQALKRPYHLDHLTLSLYIYVLIVTSSLQKRPLKESCYPLKSLYIERIYIGAPQIGLKQR